MRTPPKLEDDQFDLCGNWIVDVGEQCDLGTRNGQQDSGCTVDCRLTGRCGDSAKTCTTANDCDEGQGCCGNGVVEGSEQCDDGNRLDGDCCSSSCHDEPLGDDGLCSDGKTSCEKDSDCPRGLCVRHCQPQTCSGVGPHIRPLEARRTLLTDRDDDGRIDTWRTSGQIDSSHCYADPSAQVVALTLSQVDEILYDGLIEPDDCSDRTKCFRRFGSFLDPVWPPPPFSNEGPACRARWKFQPPKKPIVKAPSFGRARLEQNGQSEGQCSLAFQARSTRRLNMPALDGMQIRQTIQIGDNCYSGVLTCKQASKSKMKFVCTSPKSLMHSSNGSVAPGRGAPTSAPGLTASSDSKVGAGGASPSPNHGGASSPGR